MKSVTPKALNDMLVSQPITLIDVREIGEFEAGHISESVNFPLSTFRPEDLNLETKGPVVFICAVGQRSAMALNHVTEVTARQDLYNLEGGITDWMRAGYSVKDNL